MSHFARINKETSIVEEVITATQAYIFSLENSEDWIQTSYNNSIRGNYAAVGYYYDKELDAFIPPKPFDSWVLDETTFKWKSPVDKPPGGEMNGKYLTAWNENKQKWDRHYSSEDVEAGTAPQWYIDLVNGSISEAPVDYPNDGQRYEWNEEDQIWDLVPEE